MHKSLNSAEFQHQLEMTVEGRMHTEVSNALAVGNASEVILIMLNQIRWATNILGEADLLDSEEAASKLDSLVTVYNKAKAESAKANCFLAK